MMNIRIPVDVTNVTSPARPDKTNRNHRPSAAFLINKLSSDEGLTGDKNPRPCKGIPVGFVNVLSYEPFWELPDGDAGWWGCWILVVWRRGEKPEGWHLEQSLKLIYQTGFMNFFPTTGPMVETAHQY